MQDAGGNALIVLPPVSVAVVKVELHPEARVRTCATKNRRNGSLNIIQELYDRVEQIARDRINCTLGQADHADIQVIAVRWSCHV